MVLHLVKDFLNLSGEFIDSVRYPTFYTLSMRNRGSALVFKNRGSTCSTTSRNAFETTQLLFDRENIIKTFICVNNRSHEISYETCHYKVSSNHSFATLERKIEIMNCFQSANFFSKVIDILLLNMNTFWEFFNEGGKLHRNNGELLFEQSIRSIIK